MNNSVSLRLEQLGFDQQKALALLENNAWLDAKGLSLGQERAENAFEFFSTPHCHDQHLFMLGYPAIDSKALIRELLLSHPLSSDNVYDAVYCEDVKNPRKPVCLTLPKGQGLKFSRLVNSWLKQSATLLAAQEKEFKQLQQQKLSANPEHIEETFVTSAFSDHINPLLTVFKRLPEVKSYLSDLAKQLDYGYQLSHPVVCNNFVSHQGDDQFPIVFCDNPDSVKLFGDIAIVTEQGTTVANHHLLQPGLLHQANGGVLILPAERLLENPELWFELKSSLFDHQIKWRCSSQWLDPESMDLRLQIILVGDSMAYKGFLHLDPDIIQLFPLIAEVNHQYSLDTESAYISYAGYLQNIARRSNCNDLTNAGLVCLMNFSSMLIEHQHKVSLDSAIFKSLIQQAQTFVDVKDQFIDEPHIEQAIAAYNLRKNRIAQYSFEAIKEKQLLLVTQGQAIGQINALSVLDTDLDCFGEPSRVTAAVYLGNGEIDDVERKVDLAGNIHAKGVAILTSYLHQKFALEDDIPLAANLVFEQSYQGIDGDSAAMASLLCLLSAFADKPLEQGIAVTGAMDQFGNILAIGGVNEKISGFYKACEVNGFGKRQGVIIPMSNINNLNLTPKIRQAVKDKRFYIYPVSHIEQAIELVFSLTAGQVNEDSTYPQDSLYGAIKQRIDKLNSHDHQPESLWDRLKFWTN
ncbi:AAA family ATPase [Psychrobium sp. 1_MG-2023]|uniref:AAA family ATPase n=1 Tax=Psychrobium sp. 1_MG-2023 TaxID=3062624 RepID=UPI000C338BEA|nr:AAA family ATPase [Psychrobium sp. 1_MG-2023]MDP2560326.1 AAA family ATPase [Psychrobium sp. 1_MG-2023]PKF55438.1 hypothetical protein CW748_13135 [Alteromonadales bacterium alter-6D02]